MMAEVTKDNHAMMNLFKRWEDKIDPLNTFVISFVFLCNTVLLSHKDKFINEEF